MFFLFCYHKRYVLLDRPASTRETRDIPQWLIRSTCNLRNYHEHMLFIERLKVATTFDFMGTLNCSLFVVWQCQRARTSSSFPVAVTSQKQNQSCHKIKSEACLAKSAALYRLKRNSQSSRISLFYLSRSKKKKSKMRIQGRLYLFYLFFAPAVIYLTFWKNEKFTSQVQLNYLKTKRQGHHPLY